MPTLKACRVSSTFQYGHERNPNNYGMQMASRIRVIGEEGVGDDSFSKAKEWLVDAQHVVFLGFSFDTTNMERLGLAQGLKPSYQSDQSYQRQIMRETHPLTYGLERAERSALVKKYFSDFSFAGSYWTDPQRDDLTISGAHILMPITQYLRRYGGLMKI
jgi:hypothetical protein